MWGDPKTRKCYKKSRKNTKKKKSETKKGRKKLWIFNFDLSFTVKDLFMGATFRFYYTCIMIS